MRSFFAKRGVRITTAWLASSMSSHAVMAAPVGMGAQVAASIVAGGSTASGNAVAWMKLMAWMNSNPMGTAAALVAASIGLYAVVDWHSSRTISIDNQEAAPLLLAQNATEGDF
jgi:hypothetical protein